MSEGSYQGHQPIGRCPFGRAVFGILGPDGPGRTTTVECVEGLRVPDAGRGRVTGLDPVADHEGVARVPGGRVAERPVPAQSVYGSSPAAVRSQDAFSSASNSGRSGARSACSRESAARL